MIIVWSLIICALISPVHCSEFLATVRTLFGDFVQFGHAPDMVMERCSVQVLYNCSMACRIGVEIVLSTPARTGVIVFRKTWKHERFGKPRSRKVPLVFPPAVVYQRDFFIRRPVEVHDVVLRAWILHLGEEEIGGKRVGGFNQSLMKTSKYLRTLPPSERPARPWTRSVSWGSWLMWQLTKDMVKICLHESDTVDLLTFPFASTGEKYGVMHTFSSFRNRDLERRRTLAIKQPSVTLSVWLYLLSWCNKSLCGIFKNVNEHRKYGSPLIMMSDTGDIVLQVCMASGKERAFTAHTALPLHTWIRLDIFLKVSKIKVTVTKVGPTGKTVETTHLFDFHQPIQYNDTSGYFMIGGCNYMQGIHGYFGPIRYYRLGSEKVINPMSPVRTLKELDRVHRNCEEMRQVTESYRQALRHNHKSTDVCESYGSLWRTFGHRECAQTWSWDQQRKFNITLKLLEDNQDILTGLQGSSTFLRHLSHMIFHDVVKKISKAEESDQGQKLMSSVLELLQVSSCWGHHHSSLLLATLHLAGLGIPVDLEQGHVYSLIGGVSDNRLSLMHLGYKHMQGLDGFPKDHNTAYGYYANIGKQTSIDHDKVHDSGQTLIEHVHLNNDDELQTQTGESGDIVQYLKHQAERGDVESQKTLARMLLWGSNGVGKDIRAAMMWYARSALQMTDPTAMYDYAIFLLKGTGMRKNQTLGLELLEKAADMGSVEALNGLGWYYSTIVKDGKKAIQYFELAAQNGSRDGLFNVGVYHLNGANPEKPDRNETAAFHYFLRAAQMGHIEGAVESALFLSSGTIQGVKRDQQKAVLLLTRVSEFNGHLGFMVRKALQTYQRGSWDEALVKYAMLAETGLGVAQHNAAYLCEVLNHRSHCQWRYHNYSTFNHIPQEAGLLRMGDNYRDMADMVKAMDMYGTAAVHGSPQGLFNLAMLIEEGYEVPQNKLDQMSISTAEKMNRSTVVEMLLYRCREFEEGEVTPCALVLWRIHLMRAWREFTHSSVQLLLACATLTTLTVFVFAVLLRTLLAVCYSGASLSTNQSLEIQRDPTLNGHQIRSGPLETSTHQGQTQQPTTAHNCRSLQETVDLVVTVTGVCACVIFTMLISHLL
ncbi:protein sel-1 homolog 3 isoform X1 [Xyrauchen texanus]|uniref:protein sel-1 homolog 3 isoform X1 n=2 Tax=Xyrauchen texanus TaxID=154827 RepID=UPI002241E460|nr:protein sel-1 homolog 3 isoform X1 [Xyrauchen texanus]